MPARGRILYDMVGIATLLRQKEFQVPIYQRSYAWGATEVEDFWNDVRQALDAGEHDYFLGSLVLTPSDTDAKRLTIIDGQQRLATCSILLAAMRDVWAENDEPERADDVQKSYLASFDMRNKEEVPRLILNEEDDPFFRQRIVEKQTPSATRESHERLNSAYSALLGRLQQDFADAGRNGEARLLAWLDFLGEKTSAITVEVPTESDAFVIFETLNTRGAELTIGDMLKNYLFMRSGSRLETVKTAWISTLTALDISAENDVFVNFLRHHWSSKNGAVRERELYKSIHDNITTATQSVNYAKEMVQAAKFYAALTNPEHDYWRGSSFSTTTKNNVETLARLELEQNRPLLLAVMQHFSKAELRRTLHALVNWSVRGLIVGGIGGGRTERAYCEAAVKVRSGEIKTTAALLKDLSPIIPDDTTFADEFKRSRQTKSRISRYLLLALERTKMGVKQPELVPNKNEDEVNLEHVLPRNGKIKDWPSFTEEEIPVWSQRLGNHCLLKKSENEAIGNKPWSTKQPVLKKSSLLLSKEVATRKNWTAKEIAARQEALAALAVQTWPRTVKT